MVRPPQFDESHHETVEAIKGLIRRCVTQARELPLEELPRVIGGLTEAVVTLLAELMRPAPAQEPDRLIDVQEVARQIRQSTDYVYDHQRELGGVKQGSSLRFRLSAIQRYISLNAGLPATRHYGKLEAGGPHETSGETPKRRKRKRKNNHTDAETAGRQGEAPCD